MGDGMESNEKNGLKIGTGSSVAEMMQPRVQAIKSALKTDTVVPLSCFIKHLFKLYSKGNSGCYQHSISKIIQGRENHVTERIHISKINPFS